MFDNVIDPLKYNSDITLSHHFISTINIDNSSHGLNMDDLIYLIVAIIILFIAGFYIFCIRMKLKTKKKGHISIHEFNNQLK